MKKSIFILVLLLVVIAGGYYLLQRGKLAKIQSDYPQVDFSYCEGLTSSDLELCANESIILEARRMNSTELCENLLVPGRRDDCLSRVNAVQNLTNSRISFCADAQDPQECEQLFTVLFASELAQPEQCSSINDQNLQEYCEIRSLPSGRDLGEEVVVEELNPISFTLNCNGDAVCQQELNQGNAAVLAGDPALCPSGTSQIALRCPFETAVYTAYTRNDFSICDTLAASFSGGESISTCKTHVTLAYALAQGDGGICDQANGNGGSRAACVNLYDRMIGGRFDYLGQPSLTE